MPGTFTIPFRSTRFFYTCPMIVVDDEMVNGSWIERTEFIFRSQYKNSGVFLFGYSQRKNMLIGSGWIFIKQDGQDT